MSVKYKFVPDNTAVRYFINYSYNELMWEVKDGYKPQFNARGHLLRGSSTGEVSFEVVCLCEEKQQALSVAEALEYTYT